MTTPATGDLPDWSVLTNPNILSKAVTDQAGGVTTPLISQSTPYRIWAAWVAVSAVTAGAYVTAANFWGARVGDGAGNPLLRSQVGFVAALNYANHGLVMAMNGYTPVFSGGLYTTNFVTDNAITNAVTRASGGILYSIP